MNDNVTIRGNVGNDPVRHILPSGDSVLNFRVASSHGYRDRRTGAWVETGTNWVAVSAFHRLADNAKASLRSGDAVIITGRLQLKEWQNNGRSGFSADVVADTISHDLDRGISNFMRTPRANAAAQASEPAASVPESAEAPESAGAAEQDADAMDAWAQAGLHRIDPVTGEISMGEDQVDIDAEEDEYADA